MISGSGARSTPDDTGVERYPHQYAAVYSLAERLRTRGLAVEWTGDKADNRLVVTSRDTSTTPVIVETRPNPTDADRLWHYVGDDPVDPTGAPDAVGRIAARVAGGAS